MMTQNEIVEMARQAGANVRFSKHHIAFIETFAKLVAAKEREACANLCQNMYKKWVKDKIGDIGIADPSDCANAIRARSISRGEA